jgi:hypothetical protein
MGTQTLMAYAQMDSPLPGLTVSPNGCRSCGMRGLGQDTTTFDTTSTYDTTDLTPPDVSTPYSLTYNAPTDLSSPGPVDLSTLPATNTISPSVESMYPSSVGTEFVSNGDGTYTNIQTGQSVPYATAQQVTAATTGSATASVDTTATQGTVTLTDPNSGVTSTIQTNNLTAAAQALNASGQLVTAAGKLTAQGQALLNAGNLYGAPPTTNPLTSLTSWMSAANLIPGIPNIGVLGIGILAIALIPALLPEKKRRR